MTWKFDPHALKPGDAVFIARQYGWSGNEVAEWTVKRVTPTGQVTIRLGNTEDRLNASGKVMSSTSKWSQGPFVVSPERAAEIRKDRQNRDRFREIEDAAERVRKACHPNNMDVAAISTAVAEIVAALALIAGDA